MNPPSSVLNTRTILAAAKPSMNVDSPDSSPAKPTLILVADMSLGEAARAVLALQFDQMIANEAGTIRGDDPDALHEMRVATRRLRAAFRDFRNAFDQEIVEPLVEDVQWLADLLGQVRDLDVFLEWLNNYAAIVPSAERRFVRQVIKNRQGARQEEHATLIAGLNSPRYEELKHAFRLRVLGKSVLCPNENEPLVELAESKIKAHLKRVRQLGKKADLNHLKRLHLLRIEYKRMRYTSEFFSSLFSNFPKKLIDRSRDIQDLLGAVHDSYVQSEFLKDMRRSQSNNSGMRNALAKMIRARQGEQLAKYSDFQRIYRTFGAKKFQRKIAKRLHRSRAT